MNPPSAIHRVVLVVLDGLRPDAIDAFGLSALSTLAARGASTLTARTVTPSVTAAAMASLFTGVAPRHHGVVSDRFHIPRRRASIDPVPRLLSAAGYPCTAFIGAVPRLYAGLVRRIAQQIGIDGVRCLGATGREILATARATLVAQRRGLIVMHWPDVDRAGHDAGWMTPAYGEAARALDLALGELAAMLAREEHRGTLLVVLADHGGGGVIPTDHDSTHPADQTIPIILSGTDVAPGALGHRVTLLDVPATVLWALRLPRPAGYGGRPLVEAFRTAVAAA
jgi:predicted AlkP superfamily pyrophosphatase or phosphodiesterase